jgi:hypothetical protein
LEYTVNLNDSPSAIAAFNNLPVKDAALAEVSAMSQTVLKQLPAGITPLTILSFNASSVPVLQIARPSCTWATSRM